MSTITILHKDSPLIDSFIEAGTKVTPSLIDHVISSWTLNDVQTRTDLDPELISVCIDPIIPEDENPVVPAIVFDAAEDAIQHLSAANYHKLRAEQPGLFPAPVVEPEPEPRYKTHMTSSEFVRDLITQEEWQAVETHAQINAAVAAWRDITISGGVWTEHDDFEAGLQLAGSLGIWDEVRADEIRKGLLIT